MHVNVLGFGGAEIGFGGVAQSTVTPMLNHMLDSGLNVIDTAECYVDSEQKIGEAVSHRRDDYYLFTKCGHASGFPDPDWDPTMLRNTIDRSLARLKTDHLDLVQLHSCSIEQLEHGEVVEVLVQAKAAGKTRYIGYSGDGYDAKFAVELGVFDALQTSVSLADQEPIDLTLPLAKKHGMGVIAKRPIANTAWRHASVDGAGYGAEYWRRLQVLKYEFDDMVDAALRFTLSQDIHVAIVGASQPDRWRANNIHADHGPLPASQLAEIRKRWHEVAGADWVGQT